MWFYMDTTGQEFGPYPSSTMKDWFQQGFFPMQGELQVRLEDMSQDSYYHIRDLYPEPIMQRAFDGEPNPPSDGRRGGGGGGRNNRSGGGSRNAAPPASAFPMDAPPYDGGLGAALWGGMAGMPGMMPGAAMQSPGMAPFGFPGMRPGMMQGMMPGGMPMMPGPGTATGRFQGLVKSYNVQKGFGFIDCPEAHQIYGRDVFLHKAQIANFQIGSQLTFAVEMNKNNMPQARDLLETDMSGLGFPGGMGGMGFGGGMPGGGGGGGGKGGYQKGGGGGKGKGAGGKNSKPKAKAGAEPKKAGEQKSEKKAGGGGGGKKSQGAPAPGAAAPAPVADA